MKKLILLLFSLLLCGCSHDMNRREIDEINFIHVMGIDYSPGEYTLTAMYSSSRGAYPEEGGSSGKEEVTIGKGRTPYEAFENLKLKNKKTLSVANTGYFLVGEGACVQGIDECLDFLSRDETIKMESLIFITRGMAASDFIQQGIENKQTVHEDLQAIEQKQRELITRNDNTLVNILNEMEQDYSSVIIPYLMSEENSFLIKGYAVFDRLVLADYLDLETSVGVNFIKDIVREYPIYLEDAIGLSLSYSKTRLKSKLQNNRITVMIHVDFETMIKEVNTGEEIFQREQLLRLTEEQNDYIRNVLKKATDYCASTGLDILQIARLIENQHNKQWGKLKESWRDSISDIRYEYVINSKIAKSFILGNER